MLPSLSQLPIGAPNVPVLPDLRKEASGTNSESSSSDSDSDSSSDSDSESEETENTQEKNEKLLYRNFLTFDVSLDEKNPSLLSPYEFYKLDLYEVEFDPDVPGMMQSATRYFPCHVFWSLRTKSDDYKVWGRPTQTQIEEESVIAMLEKQRMERLKYHLVVNERKWKEACDRQCRNQRLEISAEGATQRASTRRASEAIQDAKDFEAVALEAVAAVRAERERERERRFGNREGLDPVPPGRIATILHRIHRREGATNLTNERAEVLINRGLKRLGMEALAFGGFALVSAIAYLQRLQEEQEQQGPSTMPQPSILQRMGILGASESLHMGAKANKPLGTVRDR